MWYLTYFRTTNISFEMEFIKDFFNKEIVIALSSSCDRKTNCETRGRLAQNISKEDTTSTGIHYHLYESVNFLVVITPQHAFYKGTSPHPVRAEITLCIIKPRIRLSKCAFIYIFCGVYDFL